MSGRCRIRMERWLIWQVEGVWIFVVYRKQGGEVRETNGLMRRVKVTSSFRVEVAMGWLVLGCWLQKMGEECY